MGRGDADRRVRALAAAQYSVFSRPQALECGLTAKQVKRRIATGAWIVLEPGLYAIGGATLTWESRVMAAQLASGRGAACSGRTAAKLMGLRDDAPDGPVEILVPHAAHDGRYKGRVVRRAVSLGRGDVRRKGHLRYTCPARTLVDLAAYADVRELEATLDEALDRGLVSLDAIRRYIADRNLSHKRGVGRLRRLLDDRSKGVPQKELEREFIRLARKHGLPAPVRQYRVDGKKVDFAYPDAKVAIELDGWATHRTREAFEVDHARDAELVALGFDVLRFTWKQLKHREAWVAQMVFAALNGSTGTP